MIIIYINYLNERIEIFMIKSKKKAIGFSRYDSKGNVVYSESLKKEGETVRHFYSYDDFGRRIHYRKEEDDNIFDESTTYLDNGYITYKTDGVEYMDCIYLNMNQFKPSTTYTIILDILIKVGLSWIKNVLNVER